jgi:L-lactate dehydrogenase complex protein LldF
VCPVKIDLHLQLYAWRHELVTKGLLSRTKRWTMKLAAKVLGSPRLYALAGRLGRFALRWLPRFVVYNRFNTWGRQRDLPPAPKKSFRQMYREREQKAAKGRIGLDTGLENPRSVRK